MPKLYRYQKTSDEYTTYGPQGEGITELCTLPDGFTYISVPEDGKLSNVQPKQIKVEEVILTDELKEQIKTASPHCQLIYTRMQEKIRAKYCDEDEKYLTRISIGQLAGWYSLQPGEMDLIMEFQTFIEGVRQWGRDERAKLGL